MEKDEIQVIDESVIITKFSPLEAKLRRMAEAAKDITAEDFEDKNKMALVKSNQLSLRDMRTDLEKLGKMLRDPHTTFNSRVLEKEREFIAIIEPEEKRLKAIRTEADKLIEIESRKLLLPARTDMLTALGITDIKDETLLDLDPSQFQEFYNKCVADKNERDRQALEDVRIKEDEMRAKAQRDHEEVIAKERKALDDERNKIEAEKQRIQHEKDLIAATEKARTEERERAERAEKERKEDAERVRLREVAAQEAAAKAEEEKRLADQATLEAKKKYQAFLAKHKYVEGYDFILSREDNTVRLYKIVGTLKL